jgi:hypothetical protein
MKAVSIIRQHDPRLWRIKLACLVAAVGFAISTPVAHLLLGKFAYGPGSEVHGFITPSVKFARFGDAAIIIGGGILPALAVLWWWAPDKDLAIVNYVFCALYWASSLGFGVLAVSWSSLASLRSGNADSFAMAALAITFFPMEIGAFRVYACLLLGISSFLVATASANTDGLMTAIACVLLAVLIVWLNLFRAAIEKRGVAPLARA